MGMQDVGGCSWFMLSLCAIKLKNPHSYIMLECNRSSMMLFMLSLGYPFDEGGFLEMVFWLVRLDIHT